MDILNFFEFLYIDKKLQKKAQNVTNRYGVDCYGVDKTSFKVSWTAQQVERIIALMSHLVKVLVLHPTYIPGYVWPKEALIKPRYGGDV